MKNTPLASHHFSWLKVKSLLFYLSCGFICESIWFYTSIQYWQITWSNEGQCVFPMLTNPVAVSGICLTSIILLNIAELSAWLTATNYTLRQAIEGAHNQSDLDRHISEVHGKTQPDLHSVTRLTAVSCHRAMAFCLRFTLFKPSSKDALSVSCVLQQALASLVLKNSWYMWECFM